MSSATDTPVQTIPALSDEPLAIRIIENETAWDAIAAAWEALYLASPTVATPLAFAWLRRWWRIFGPVYGTGLRIVTLWRGTTLVGALPLYLGRGHGGTLGARCLRMMSTGEDEYEETCPDYLNLLHLPGEEEACARAAWTAIGTMTWDVLDLVDLPDDSPLLRWRDTGGGVGSRAVIRHRGVCPLADLRQGFDAYLADLSSKTRMRARQEIRKVERVGAVFELATAADAGAFFDDLIAVHQERWNADGQPGCFAAPRFTEFHRELIHEWVGQGRAVLARLSHAGRPCAILYGFVTGQRFELYQLGVRAAEGAAIHSPGTAANLLLMARLVERGIGYYDFLRGESAFKKSLTTGRRTLVRLECRKPTVRTAVDQIAHLASRGGRKVLRALRSH
jgi:CelD/BcsL family acetyltransferase involved in cellulose biosynthesis